MSFVCFNGDILTSGHVTIDELRRGFLYGDGFFESIYFHKKSPLLSYHIARMQKAAGIFEFEVHPVLKSEMDLARLIDTLTQKLALEVPVRVRLSIWRKGESLYASNESKSNFLIEISPITNPPENLRLGVYHLEKKPIDMFSSIKKLGQSFYVKAGMWCLNNNFDECLIFNHLNQVIETLYSNIFIMKNGQIFTSVSGTGAVDGVMKNALSEKLPKWGHTTKMIDLDLQTITDADEIFLTNGIRGVQPVDFFNGKKYETKTGKEIQAQVRECWF